MRRLFLGGAALLSACLFAPSRPEVLSLTPPPPPDPRPGEIRVYGAGLSDGRAREVAERIRSAEGRIVSAYEAILADDPYAEGWLQLRIGVTGSGRVAAVEEVASDLNDEAIAERIPAVLETLEFGPGGEAFVFYTLAFQPRPFEVLGIRPEFDTDPPALAAEVLNRSVFRLSEVEAIVSVERPDRAGPVRVSRRRLRAPFEPNGRRAIRLPVPPEWANPAYTFLVEVRPAAPSPDSRRDRKPQPAAEGSPR